MSTRVVITGMGVVAPNGNGVQDFELALRKGRSGIRSERGHGRARASRAGWPACPRVSTRSRSRLLRRRPAAGDEPLSPLRAIALSTPGATPASHVPEAGDDAVDWDSGAILGTGIGGMDTIGERVVPLTDAGKVRRLGSTAVEQVMASGVSARVSGLLALGNQVTTNSSACSTGTEADCSSAPSASAAGSDAHAVRRRGRREPLHLGGLRRDAGAVPHEQRRARSVPRVP